MSKRILKSSLLALVIAIISMILLKINVLAVEGEANIEVIKNENGESVVYVEGVSNFSYAISTTPSATEMELDYIKSTNDGAGTEVAIIKETGTVYLWIKEGENQIITSKEINLDEEAFTTSDLNGVGEVTQKIVTTVEEKSSEETTVDEAGVSKNLTLSALKIESEGEGYTYQIFSAENEYGTLMELAENLPEKLNTYEGIKIAKQFNSVYLSILSTLKSENWILAENKIINQPNDVENGAKHVVFIKNSDGSVIDVQFLTSEENKDEKYEKEKIVVQETSKLPITGESLGLIIAFAVVVVLMVIVFVKMKKSKTEADK